MLPSTFTPSNQERENLPDGEQGQPFKNNAGDALEEYKRLAVEAKKLESREANLLEEVSNVRDTELDAQKRLNSFVVKKLRPHSQNSQDTTGTNELPGSNDDLGRAPTLSMIPASTTQSSLLVPDAPSPLVAGDQKPASDQHSTGRRSPFLPAPVSNSDLISSLGHPTQGVPTEASMLFAKTTSGTNTFKRVPASSLDSPTPQIKGRRLMKPSPDGQQPSTALFCFAKASFSLTPATTRSGSPPSQGVSNNNAADELNANDAAPVPSTSVVFCPITGSMLDEANADNDATEAQIHNTHNTR
ncbi:unnamed protein product [Cylindrotheca closterium]|uniref:Uncharacterized protein n=1 Tax=Cylindrotheca closterium TaxID=2856 RepID=A0AAD2G765_9STRA|nr:unnamed protein product [Cylindrotheca closterium]